MKPERARARSENALFSLRLVANWKNTAATLASAPASLLSHTTPSLLRLTPSAFSLPRPSTNAANRYTQQLQLG